MKKTMQVQGMSCGHCKQSVEGAINGIDGVSEAKVNLSTGEVEIDFDDSKVTTKQLKDTVEEQGYDVVAP
ncbi:MULTISPECIES: copper chaperone CopZ [unclassified Oceanobacillus]|uniref:copper chaperone CopZ n=1 Tax=unclassified Oceanobacillus TaxID=2630292 RepID=UPI001BE7A693|nr:MULTISPECIES: copper chaperone CopZ [unclassified Oceanobacillus]MBT2599154.1 copper chaperone CopZ [Oceanobacillus sp. ISL-74]MBT2652072.1 copper chaperone CopZ [Oceanobacillus sp. ISL-73]